MLVKQDKAIMPEEVKIIRYVEDHPCKIVYRPLQTDGQPVEEDVVLEDALVLGPSYHGLSIRVRTKEGNITAIAREHLVSITQPNIAGGLGKSIYFGETAPIQNFGNAGDIFVTKDGVMEKQEKWVSVYGEGGSGAEAGGSTDDTGDTP